MTNVVYTNPAVTVSCPVQLVSETVEVCAPFSRLSTVQHDRLMVACSYTIIPDVIRDPRARIRFLQQHLSRAQQVAQDPQQRLPETIALDAFTYRDQSTLTAPSTTSFLDTSVRSVHSFADVDSCRNLASNTSLIRSLLRLVSDNNEVASILACGTIDALLAGSPIAQEPMVQVFCQLSHYSSMLGIVHSAFSQIFALSSIVPEKYFRVRAQSLYDVNPIAYEPQDMAFTPLFFAVIALGMIYSPDLHPDMSHQQVLRRRYVMLGPRKYRPLTHPPQ